MAIGIQDPNTGANMQVSAQHGAARVSIRPTDVSGWFSLGVKSGATTTLAAGAAVFSLRNTSANPIMLRRIGLGAVLTTAFTTAQIMEYAAYIARGWTAADSAGTAIVITGNSNKHRTALSSPTALEARIAAAAAVTAGTRTLDTNALGIVGGWAGAIGTIINPVPNNLIQHDPGDYPIILAQNEGLVLTNVTLMGAGGVATVYVNAEFAEVASY